jgi:hypothetical protein
MRPGDVIEVDALLRDLGYAHRKALKASRAALIRAGLTRDGKSAIPASKRGSAADLLRREFALLCSNSDCREEYEARIRSGMAPAGRKILPALDEGRCEVCGGSNNARAVGRLIRLLALHGVRRMLVVGGSPASRAQLESLLAGTVALRLVSGTQRRTREEARRDLEWADLTVVWGGTQLDHKVSNLYSRGRTSGAFIVMLRRRGIEALAQVVSDRLEGSGADTTAP